MGNTNIKPPKTGNRKQLHWKAADRPFPPGKPHHVTKDADLSPDILTISWSKPIRDGGSPVTGYLVEHKRIGSSHWSRANPYLVSGTELSVGGLDPGWRYQFRVRAENAVGISDSSEVSDTFTVAPERYAVTAPRFLEELQNATALENDKIEFVAQYFGQPPPTIAWYKDGFEIFSSRRTRIITEPDRSVLTIHQSALADEGEIKCTATNRAGHASTKARLTLEAPPGIRLPRQYEDGLLFEIGEMIKLKVSVVGLPPPLVFWSHDGESMQSGDRYEVESIGNMSVVKIPECKRSDRGEYQIRVVNKIGEDTASFLVTVTDKPSPPGKAKVIMTLGRSVTLSWNLPVDDGGCKIGNYIVEYYRVGWNVWLKAATSRQMSTILGDLIEGSEYKFRVKAESPYGVSDPSEESDVVFIPDPKRGITTPHLRSLSQPRDIIDEITKGPVAIKRKGKKQPRSQSETMVEEVQKMEESRIPIRPERTKVKSPPLSPEVTKKNLPNFNKTILDRASIARELAYGSPEIIARNKASFDDENLSSPEKSINSSPNRSNSKSNSPMSDLERLTITKQTKKEENVEPKDNFNNFGGSSEFMLVLYPDNNEKGQKQLSDLIMSFEENSIPPPLSLSAPELGTEPPQFGNLRQSSSSSELLHERAMMRFNEVSELIENASENKSSKVTPNQKTLSIEIPKIQINSMEHIDSLERRYSPGRRRSASGLSQQQAKWAHRRLSLKNAMNINEVGNEDDLEVSNQLNYSISIKKQRSESIEKEEEEFKKVREKMGLEKQSSLEKKSIKIADEISWMESYEESISEEETESSSDLDFSKKHIFEQPDSSDNEEDTYHPRMSSVLSSKHISDEPFEILTQRQKLPDPNFVPKPILKKTEDRFESTKTNLLKINSSREVNPKIRANSPVPITTQETVNREKMAHFKVAQSKNPPLPEKLNPTLEKENISFEQKEDKAIPNKDEISKMLPESLPVAPSFSISAVAQLTGFTAASIVLSEGIMKKRDHEEAKVAIDHYGHIVEKYGNRRASINEKPNLRKSERRTVSESDSDNKVETIQKAMEQTSKEQKIEEQKCNEPKPNIYTSMKTSTYENKRKSSLSRDRPLHFNQSNEFAEINICPSTSVSKPIETIDSKVVRGKVSGKMEKKVFKKSPKRNRTPSLLSSGHSSLSSLSSDKDSLSNIETSTDKVSELTQAYLTPVRRPMLKEIMTQTSIGLEWNKSGRIESISNKSELGDSDKQMGRVELKIRNLVDYSTDIVMFIVACWLYLFSNELLALPILAIMVYRQLKDAVIERMPDWIMKHFREREKNNRN